MTLAIFSTGGAQFRAEPESTIKIPLLEAEPGSSGVSTGGSASDGTARAGGGSPW